LNPELVICNLIVNQTEFRFNNRKGRGYVPAEENKKQNAVELFLQILFYPVKKCKIFIENSGAKTDYEN
jgi:DNA-directed RNA polymerase subunit alpha